MTRERDIAPTIDDAHTELRHWDATVVERILERLHDNRPGFPSGHDHARPLVRFDREGRVVDYAQTSDEAKLTSHSDRTGEAIAANTPDDADAARREILRSVDQLRQATATLARIRHDWGTLALPECCRAHLMAGVRVPVARGVYARFCRACGEDVARNDGHLTPKAIMEAIATGAPISDQLIAAHPLPNGNLWRRAKPRTTTGQKR